MAYFGKEIKGDILRVLVVLNVLILTNIGTKLREDQGQEILSQELNDIFYNMKLMKLKLNLLWLILKLASGNPFATFLHKMCTANWSWTIFA